MRTLEKHYTLEQAVKEFFADGPITVTTLRSAIKKQKLQATMPEGKLLVTETWLVEWLSRCRVTADLPASGSDLASADELAPGSSSTDRNNAALDAAKLVLSKRS